LKKRDKRLVMSIIFFSILGFYGYFSNKEPYLAAFVWVFLISSFLLLDYFELIFIKIYYFVNYEKKKIPFSLIFVYFIYLFNIYISFDKLSWIITIILILPNLYFFGTNSYAKKYLLLLSFKIIMFVLILFVGADVYHSFLSKIIPEAREKLMQYHIFFIGIKAMIYYYIYLSLFKIYKVTAIALGVWKKPKNKLKQQNRNEE